MFAPTAGIVRIAEEDGLILFIPLRGRTIHSPISGIIPVGWSGIKFTADGLAIGLKCGIMYLVGGGFHRSWHGSLKRTKRDDPTGRSTTMS